METINLELWNHGLAGSPNKPCGEVEIFEVTGFKIHAELIKSLASAEPYGDKHDWFGHLPTESILKVVGVISCEAGQFWIDVLKFK